MKTEQLVNQLLNGNHLSQNEIKEAKELVYKLKNAIERLEPEVIEFTNIN